MTEVCVCGHPLSDHREHVMSVADVARGLDNVTVLPGIVVSRV